MPGAPLTIPVESLDGKVTLRNQKIVKKYRDLQRLFLLYADFFFDQANSRFSKVLLSAKRASHRMCFLSINLTLVGSGKCREARWRAGHPPGEFRG